MTLADARQNVTGADRACDPCGPLGRSTVTACPGGFAGRVDAVDRVRALIGGPATRGQHLNDFPPVPYFGAHASPGVACRAATTGVGVGLVRSEGGD